MRILRLRGVLAGVIGVIIAHAITFGLFTTASAVNNFSWKDDARVSTVSSLQPVTQCVTMPIVYMDINPLMNGLSTTVSGCVYQARDFSLAQFRSSGSQFMWAVRLGSDTKYRVLNDMGTINRPTVSPDSNKLLFYSHTYFGTYATLTSVEDLPASLVATDWNDTYTEPTRYSIDATKQYKWFSNGSGDENGYGRVKSFVMSRNGKYALAWVGTMLHVKINLETGETQALGTVRPTSWGSEADYALAAAITDDGRYAFTSDGPTVFDTKNCGFMVTQENLADGTAYDSHQPSCPKRSYGEAVQQHAGQTGFTHGFYWSYGNVELRFRLTSYAASNQNREQTITLSRDMEQADRLEYLALGDSYSSGEGDYDPDKQVFLPMTDFQGEPTEDCHVSSRSYPFLLAERYNINSDKMKSVACSGALMNDVVMNINPFQQWQEKYYGQNGRLRSLSTSQLSEYQTAALSSFVPGRIPQIEFVRKYKPKVITIGIGGNDAMFAKIIGRCVGRPLEICDEASDQNNAREIVAMTIQNQYFVQRNLYRQISHASPDSRLYAIGYPQFIADSSSACLLNGGNVSNEERHFMNEAVSFMNTVIGAAAKAEGVRYIDIEDSLDGGKLCEGVVDDYVTGLRNQAYKAVLEPPDIKILKTFLYHPNSEGHKKVAATIASSIGDEFNSPEVISPDPEAQVPDFSEYFATARNYNAKRIISGSIILDVQPQQGETLRAKLKPHSFGYETVTVTAYSDPIVLGSVMPEQDGGLEYEFTVPHELPAGFHTLSFKGVSISGEPIEYIESMFVVGDDQNDIDDDGIIDAQDECIFNVLCRDLPAGEIKDEGNVAGSETGQSVASKSINKKQLNIADETMDDAFLESGEPRPAVAGAATIKDSIAETEANRSEQSMSWFTLLLLASTIAVIGLIARRKYAQQ